MRLITRRDTSLAIGLIIATVVVFQQPLRWLLDIAHEMETRYHLDLVPALLVLVAVFAFHQHSKRQQSKADALVAANDAAEARARSEELGRLMAMGQAAGNALFLEELIRAVAEGEALLGVGVALRVLQQFAELRPSISSSGVARSIVGGGRTRRIDTARDGGAAPDRAGAPKPRDR